MKSEDTFIERLRDIFVTIEVFDLRIAPLEKIGYGVVAMIVIAVFSAIITLVIRVK